MKFRIINKDFVIEKSQASVSREECYAEIESSGFFYLSHSGQGLKAKVSIKFINRHQKLCSDINGSIFILYLNLHKNSPDNKLVEKLASLTHLYYINDKHWRC